MISDDKQFCLFVLLITCTAVDTGNADGSADIMLAAEAAWKDVLMGAEGRLSDGVHALLRQELAQIGEHTWGKRWSMHRAIDSTHDAAASLALAEAKQLLESLREAVARTTKNGKQEHRVCPGASATAERAGDAGDCSAADQMSRSPGKTAWMSSLDAIQPGASRSARRLVRMELNETAASVWESKKRTRHALDRIFESLVSDTLAMVADVLGTLRERLDNLLMQDPRKSRSGPRRYLVREAAVGLAWDAQAAAMSGRMGDLYDDKCDFVEAGQSVLLDEHRPL